MRYDSPKLERVPGHSGTRECCLSGLKMSSLMDGGMLHVFGKLWTRAFQNAKAREEQSNALGDMALQSIGTSGLRDCCLPGLPNVQRSIAPTWKLRLGQVRSLSTSTQRVDVENGLARPIWITELQVSPRRRYGPFLRLRQKRVVFQNKSVSRKAPQHKRGGPTEDSREYYEEGWSPSSLAHGALRSRGGSKG